MKITFIGSLDSTFASRWKELYPDSITEGKEAAYDIRRRLKKGRSLDAARGSSWLDIDTGKSSSKKAKKELENRIKDSKNKGSFTKKDIADPWETLVKPENKIKSLADRKEELLKEKITNKPSEVKTKYRRKIFTNANQRKEFLTGVAKKRKFARAIRASGKLGLGAVGLAAGGALAYGLARKLRSDKGKKRGRYTR